MHLHAVAKFSLSLSLLAILVAPASATETPLGARHLKRETKTASVIASVPSVSRTLPPLQPGVTELNFQDLFKTPIGPRGLEISEKLQSLDGKRVRLLGYMVKEKADDHDHGASAAEHDDHASEESGLVRDRFLLTAFPVITNFAHYGLCDDLPAQTVYVTLAAPTGEPVPFAPNPLLLTGILSVGSQTETDGRTSVVRLKLDPAPVAAQPDLHATSFPSAQ